MLVGIVSFLILLAVLGLSFFLYSPGTSESKNEITVLVNNDTNQSLRVTVLIISKEMGKLYNHTLLALGTKDIAPDGSARFSGSEDTFNYPVQIKVSCGYEFPCRDIIIQQKPQHSIFNKQRK
jgi:hypothetical protein